MPELPEVETVVRSLAPLIRGREIAGARLRLEKLVRRPAAFGLEALAGRRILDVSRRGKMVRIGVEGGLSLVFHLKMTGQLLVRPAAEPLDKHTHFCLAFRDDGAELRFRDVRKFGFLACLRTGGLDSSEVFAGLGPEPLETGREAFAALFHSRRGRIKSALLDQRVIAGLGNIYADEALFAAHIHPLTSAARLRKPDLERLWREVRRVLRRAIASRGTSVSDYLDAEGLEGEFQERLRVYGRTGEPCPRCGTPIRRIVVGGRGTHFCPRCQRRR